MASVRPGAGASARTGGQARGSTGLRLGGRSRSPDPGTAQTLGLRGLVQQRLLDDVFQSASDKWPGWKVLVVDEHAMRVISSSVGMYDVMERRITLVENLDRKRAPFQDMGAIYLIEPSKESVHKMIADFSVGLHGKPLYGSAVFLFFLGRLPDQLLVEIKHCKPLMKRIKALCEVNIDFLPKEERAFTLDMRDSFADFYLRKATSPIEFTIAEKLVTVCATLNEYPHIRYRQSSAICTSLANIFHLKMDEFVSQNPNWWYHGGPTSTGKSQQTSVGRRERGTLLLLDRADDCLTPLMHDFTYQTMVHDLLKMDGDRITLQGEKTGEDDEQGQAKDILLDEKDPVWVELRGKHIAGVIETLSARIRDITNSSTGSAFGKTSGEGNMSMSEMAAALKALPEYREVLSKLSQHMQIAHECMSAFHKDRLMELSEFEQTLATGKDDDGKVPKLSDVIDTAERMLMEMKDNTARMRLILILTISQGGLRQQDRRRLVSVAELSRQEMKALNCLELLGLPTLAAADKKTLACMFKNCLADADEDSEYAASRYAPAIKGILEDLVTNNLSMEDYPSMMPMPEMAPTAKTGNRGSAARSSRRGEATSVRKSSSGTTPNRWSKSSGEETKRSTMPVSFTGSRSIVVVMGGVSYMEVKAARDVMMNESREIVMGSTTFLSPKDFIADLSRLGENDSREDTAY